jgi:uncharacterized protein YgiM (DUF1202 family)
MPTKKIVIFLLQFVIAVSLFAQTYKYTSTNLNLRSGPSISHQILESIPAGTQVEMAEECDCAWIKVVYKGKIGYVNAKYLVNGERFINSKTSTYSQNKKVKTYTNSAGQRVQSPTHSKLAPAGATALCRDGTYSFSRSRRGTCSHHGGVAKWL